MKTKRVTVPSPRLLVSSFRSSDWSPSERRQLPLAAARSLLPSSPALGHREEVHGGIRDVGPGAKGPDPRAGE